MFGRGKPAVKLPRWTPRRTLFDLYTERDQTRWYWRFAAIIASLMIMIGYAHHPQLSAPGTNLSRFLIIPSAFPNSTSTTTSKNVMTIVSIILLALGYTLSSAIYFIVPSWIFHLDILFTPCLFSSVLGLLNVVYQLSTVPFPSTDHNKYTTASILALILSTISSLTYLLITLYTAHLINHVRSRDSTNRSRRSDSESIHHLPEDELQRQQLLRLLMSREPSNKKPSLDTSQSTFRIDIPETLKFGSGNRDRSNNNTTNNKPENANLLAAPQNMYEGAGRSRSVGSTPSTQRSQVTRGLGVGVIHDAPVDPRLQALERARERSREAQRRAAVRTSPPAPGLISTPQVVSPAGMTAGQEWVPVDLKRENLMIPLGERHPLEREEYLHNLAIADRQVEEDMRGQEETSRERRREEIEMSSGSANGGASGDRGRSRQELEAGILQRIERVETDGWGRR